MLGFRYLKSRPSEYVILYKNGKIKKQGVGLNFFYFAPSSSVVIVPAVSSDTPFIFKETTIDFQEINIQGQISYRVLDQVKLATLLDFTVDINGAYSGEGMDNLTTRLTNIVQVTLRQKLKTMTLREALTSAVLLVDFAREKLKESDTIQSLGIEILDLSILDISPTPDIARALEASSREQLLKEADEAVYERRNFAVEQERRIQENELQTKISVEEMNKRIREEEMNAELLVNQKQGEINHLQMTNEIEIEQKRKELIEHQSDNLIIQSEAKAKSLDMELSTITKLPPEILQVLAENQMNVQKVISRAIKDLAVNAQKIGHLNISPDLLNNLIYQDQDHNQDHYES